MPLVRRFDLHLMQPPVPGGGVDAPLLRVLGDWCHAGTQPLAFASIASPDGLDAVACELDGSHALARLGRWRGLAWRLRVLLRDRRPGHAPRGDDPWDCGWWRDGAIVAAADFRPRRATLVLVLVRDPGPDMVDALSAALRAGSVSYVKPVRVLFVSADPVVGVNRLGCAADGRPRNTACL